MDKEEFIKNLPKHNIQQLRTIARKYGLTPSTKNQSQLISEITECVLEDKIIIRNSNRGRKPKREELEKNSIDSDNQIDKKAQAIKIINETIDKQITELQNLKNNLINLL